MLPLMLSIHNNIKTQINKIHEPHQNYNMQNPTIQQNPDANIIQASIKTIQNLKTEKSKQL